MKLIVLTLLLAAAVLPQTPASKSSPASKSGAANPSLLNPASLRAKAPDVYKAQFTTTKGDIVIEVHRDWAPLGADRFYNLVKNGFYDNAAFFRVLKGFVAQFGMNAKPTIQRAWQNANIKDDPVRQSNKRGTVTFAAASVPNSRSTQIFINIGDNSRSLDSQGFAAFGTVTEGMDVVDKLYNGYTDENGPNQGRIAADGDAYLTKYFPQLDKIKTAKILPEAPAAAPDAKK